MKNWKLFFDTLKKMKLDENGELIKCRENDLHLIMLNASGVTPDDVDKLLKNSSKK